MEKYRIDRSEISGKGVFTNVPLDVGEFIGIALIRLQSTGNDDKDYKRTPLGRYINESTPPNAEIKPEGVNFAIFAMKQIGKDAEIIVSYKNSPIETAKY